MKAIEFIKRHEDEIKTGFHVKRIGVFGSHARAQERADSDVDVLVEFEQGHVTFDNYMDLKFFLEDNLERKVDLATADAIRPQLRDIILGEVIYA
jgi:hypothetical protein